MIDVEIASARAVPVAKSGARCVVRTGQAAHVEREDLRFLLAAPLHHRVVHKSVGGTRRA